jgi:glutathione S-transferase
LVWGVYVERVSKPGRGAASDEAKIGVATAKARVCLTAMSELMGDNRWLAGAELTLADLYAAPMFDYFLKAPESKDVIREYQNLATWWSRVAARPSMKATSPHLVSG